MGIVVGIMMMAESGCRSGSGDCRGCGRGIQEMPREPV